MTASPARKSSTPAVRPGWEPARDLNPLRSFGAVPLADTELLQVAHHLPIVLRPGPDGPIVCGLIDDALLRSPCLSREGRWLRAYQPVILRCLPFWPLTKDGRLAAEPQLLSSFPVGASDPDPGSSDTWTNPTGLPGYPVVERALSQLRVGMARLTEAARLLTIADTLVPLHRPSGEDLPFWMPSQAAFRDRSGASLAAALSAHPRSLDLAVASFFSQQYLAAALRRSEANVAARSESATADPVGAFLRAQEPMPLSLDESEIFDISRFALPGP